MNFQYLTIAIGIITVISIVTALISLYIAVNTVYSRNRKFEKMFMEAYDKGDRNGIVRAQKILALEKLKTKNRRKLMAGITYIEELGGKEPFYEGFDALATELIKRKDLEVRLRIAKALYRLSIVIEKEKNKTPIT